MCGAPVLPPACLKCPREDSNLHALRHRPSTCCVCQFRHAGKTARIITRTSDLSTKMAAGVHAKGVSRGGSHAAVIRAWEPELLIA